MAWEGVWARPEALRCVASDAMARVCCFPVVWRHVRDVACHWNLRVMSFLCLGVEVKPAQQSLREGLFSLLPGTAPLLSLLPFQTACSLLLPALSALYPMEGWVSQLPICTLQTPLSPLFVCLSGPVLLPCGRGQTKANLPRRTYINRCAPR